MSAFASTLATQDGLCELKTLFKDLNTKIDKQNEEILNLKESVINQDLKISQLEDKVGVLSASVSALKKQSGNQEQYSRRYCLRIKGIEKTQNENANDCVNKVIEVCKNYNVNVNDVDIDRAHRIGKDRETMIVKFHSFWKRTDLYKARKGRNDNIQIYLDITKERLALLDQAKRLITQESSADFVFADINCNTVAHMKNKTYKFFDNIDDFKKLL